MQAITDSTKGVIKDAFCYRIRWSVELIRAYGASSGCFRYNAGKVRYLNIERELFG
ncbi:hypothetical protein D3C86_1773340 [compost metagenome]